jgi:hypothetical protein
VCTGQRRACPGAPHPQSTSSGNVSWLSAARCSLLLYVAIIVAFAATYYLLGPVAHIPLSLLEAVVFSVTSFHGRGVAPSENVALSNPLTVLAAAEAALQPVSYARMAEGAWGPDQRAGQRAVLLVGKQAVPLGRWQR